MGAPHIITWSVGNTADVKRNNVGAKRHPSNSVHSPLLWNTIDQLWGQNESRHNIYFTKSWFPSCCSATDHTYAICPYGMVPRTCHGLEVDWPGLIVTSCPITYLPLQNGSQTLLARDPILTFFFNIFVTSAFCASVYAHHFNPKSAHNIPLDVHTWRHTKDQ